MAAYVAVMGETMNM